MRIVTPALGERAYPIEIGAGALGRVGALASERFDVGRCAIVTDTVVGGLYADPVVACLREAGFDPDVITVEAGETSKRLSVVETVCDALAGLRLERRSPIFALGGGVIGDLAGFVAASYLRGTPFAQIPTTLLAQVDSSVGGKVGVNLVSGKNLVGAFYQPRFVICDIEVLNSLSEREFRAGMAEVVKYGVIWDADLFARIESELEKIRSKDSETLEDLVAECAQIKATVVERDEREGDLRRILNFGHTIGHAIEAVSGYGEYLHGEAISIGQVKAAALSVALTGLKPEEARRVRDLLDGIGLPTRQAFDVSQAAELEAAMRLDKKVSKGTVQFVLASSMGEVVCGRQVPEELLREVLMSDQSDL